MQAVRTPRAPTIARGLAVRTEATATGKATGKAKAKAKAWCPARSESVGALALAAVVALSPIALPLPALAGGSSVVSEFKTSGVVFKDSVQVLQLKDPEVQGVTCVLVGWTATAHHSLTRAHSRTLVRTRWLAGFTTRTTRGPSRRSSRAKRTRFQIPRKALSRALPAPLPPSPPGTPLPSLVKRGRRYLPNSRPSILSKTSRRGGSLSS